MVGRTPGAPPDYAPLPKPESGVRCTLLHPSVCSARGRRGESARRAENGPGSGVEEKAGLVMARSESCGSGDGAGWERDGKDEWEVAPHSRIASGGK